MGAAEAKILAEALELSDEEKLRIAEALLHSVRPDGVASADDAGVAAELRSRVAEIEHGARRHDQSVPLEEARLRQQGMRQRIEAMATDSIMGWLTVVLRQFVGQAVHTVADRFARLFKK
jgi:hypothetical protein